MYINYILLVELKNLNKYQYSQVSKCIIHLYKLVMYKYIYNLLLIYIPPKMMLHLFLIFSYLTETFKLTLSFHCKANK